MNQHEGVSSPMSKLISSLGHEPGPFPVKLPISPVRGLIWLSHGLLLLLVDQRAVCSVCSVHEGVVAALLQDPTLLQR